MNRFPVCAPRGGGGADGVILFGLEDGSALRLAQRHRGEVEGRGERQDARIGDQSGNPNETANETRRWTPSSTPTPLCTD